MELQHKVDTDKKEPGFLARIKAFIFLLDKLYTIARQIERKNKAAASNLLQRSPTTDQEIEQV